MDNPVFKEIAEAIGVLIAGIILVIVSRLSHHIKKILLERQKLANYSVEDQVERDIRLKYVLNRLLGEIGGERVFISRYHNGNFFDEGTSVLPEDSIKKKTRTHEVTAPGFAIDTQQFIGLPISLIPEEILLVREKGTGWRKMDDIPDCKFKTMLRLGGIRGSIARLALRRTGKIIGCLGIDFRDATEPPQQLHRLNDYAHEIEMILSKEPEA